MGDRLILMHRGQVIRDFQGAEKRRLRPQDLLPRFEELRQAEQLEESAAQSWPRNTSDRCSVESRLTLLRCQIVLTLTTPIGDYPSQPDDFER